MSAVDTHPPQGGEDYSEHSAAGGGGGGRLFSPWMAPPGGPVRLADARHHRPAAHHRGDTLCAGRIDRLGGRGGVDVLHLGDDDRCGPGHAPQRAPAPDPAGRPAVRSLAALCACLCIGGGGGLPAGATALCLGIHPGGVVHPHPGPGLAEQLPCRGHPLRPGGHAGDRAGLCGPDSAVAGAGHGGLAGGGHRGPVLGAAREPARTGRLEHGAVPGRRCLGVPAGRGADRLLFRPRCPELSGLHHPHPAADRGGPHGRGHVQHHPGLGADFCPAGLHPRCHRHGQGHRRLPRFAHRPCQGRHVVRTARFAVHRLGHLRLQGLRHGHGGPGPVPRDEAPRQQTPGDGGAACHRSGHGRHGAAQHRADRARLGGRGIHRRAVPERFCGGDGAVAVAAGAGALEGPS